MLKTGMAARKAPSPLGAAAVVPRAVFLPRLFPPSFPHSSKGCHLQPWGPRNPDGSQQRAPPVRQADSFPGGQSAGLPQGPLAVRDGSHTPQCVGSRWNSRFPLPKNEARCDPRARGRVSTQASRAPQGTETILPGSQLCNVTEALLSARCDPPNLVSETLNGFQVTTSTSPSTESD